MAENNNSVPVIVSLDIDKFVGVEKICNKKKISIEERI